MLIIGCDFHTRYQQIAMMDEATGELIERRLQHENGEAAAFYRSLPGLVRVGIEATGPIHWFVRLLTELGHELWIGDSAKIRASEVRKQKTDERDARLILSARNSAGWSCPIAWPILLPCRGRPACHYCDQCQRGCHTASYFNSPSVTLPAAARTGRLTLVSNAVVSHVLMNEQGKAEGVYYVDRSTHAHPSQLYVRPLSVRPRQFLRAAWALSDGPLYARGRRRLPSPIQVFAASSNRHSLRLPGSEICEHWKEREQSLPSRLSLRWRWQPGTLRPCIWTCGLRFLLAGKNSFGNSLLFCNYRAG